MLVNVSEFLLVVQALQDKNGPQWSVNVLVFMTGLHYTERKYM